MAMTMRRRALANPARPRRRPSGTRRRLTPAQIAAGFGGKRRQAAQKHKRRPMARRSNPVKRTLKAAPRRRRPQRKNIGEILTIGLGNPARITGKGKMKKSSKSKKSSARTRVTRRRKVSNPFRSRVRHARRNSSRTHTRAVARRRRRSNPSSLSRGNFTSMLSKAGWAVAGLVGARGATQFLFAAAGKAGSNTGWMGYASNVVAALVLGHLVGKLRGREAGQFVTIGGLAGVVARAVSEYSPVGKYLKAQGLSGLGDVGIYLPTQFAVPGIPEDPQTLEGGATMLNPWPMAQPPARSGVGRVSSDATSASVARYGTAGRYN